MLISYVLMTVFKSGQFRTFLDQSVLFGEGTAAVGAGSTLGAPCHASAWRGLFSDSEGLHCCDAVATQQPIAPAFQMVAPDHRRPAAAATKTSAMPGASLAVRRLGSQVVSSWTGSCMASACIDVFRVCRCGGRPLLGLLLGALASGGPGAMRCATCRRRWRLEL